MIHHGPPELRIVMNHAPTIVGHDESCPYFPKENLLSKLRSRLFSSSRAVKKFLAG